jgi:hypothetical protein
MRCEVFRLLYFDNLVTSSMCLKAMGKRLHTFPLDDFEMLNWICNGYMELYNSFLAQYNIYILWYIIILITIYLKNEHECNSIQMKQKPNAMYIYIIIYISYMHGYIIAAHLSI